MNRRQALRHAGRAAVAAALWATLPSRTWSALAAPPTWSKADEDLLTLIGETILPATPGVPGAAAVGIGRFIGVMTTECYAPAASAALRQGLEEIARASHAEFAQDFGQLPAERREAVLVAYEKRAASAAKGKGINPFRHVKELTLLGYFTSEIGATQALRYDPVPGGYRGSIPLAPRDRSWAQT